MTRCCPAPLFVLAAGAMLPRMDRRCAGCAARPSALVRLWACKSCGTRCCVHLCVREPDGTATCTACLMGEHVVNRDDDEEVI